MKLVRFFVSALLIGAVISFTACSDDEDDVVNSSTDEPSTEQPSTGDDGDEPDEPGDNTDYGEGIHFVDGTGETVYFYDYGETIEVGIVSTEAWTAAVDAEWVTVTPASGEAGASDEVQTLSVTAERSTESSTRSCTLTVTGETDEISLALSQDPQNIQVSFVERVGHLDCYFGYAYYTFSYSGVAPGDEITVSGTVSGNNDITLPTVTVTATDRAGTIDVPFQVGPEDFDFSVADSTALTTPGKVTVAPSVKILDVERYSETMTETVYVVAFDCAKFTMGGDYVGHNAGVMPDGFDEWPIYRAHSGEVDWLSDFPTVPCDWNQPAFVSPLDWTNETGFQQAFNVNRGSNSGTSPASTTQWYGTRDYMFYKQMALGSDDRPNSAGYGSWVSPVLYPFMGYITTGKLKVTVDLCPGLSTTDLSGTISIRNIEGTRTDNLIADFTSYLTEINSEDDLHWTTITCEGSIEDSTTEFVRIQSSGSSTSTTSTKFMRNFLVELE